MAQILLEIHLLESKVNEMQIMPLDSVQVVYDHFEDLKLESLGVSQEQYEISFNYYLNHPKQFEKIYTVVVDSLLQKEKTAKN